jgi:adenine-specific DNA-methyltransferase
LEPRIYKTANGITGWLATKPTQSALYEGDCIVLLSDLPEESVDLVVSSPPYCMGKAYEPGARDVDAFVQHHEEVLPLVIKALKPGGSLCWQVGYHFYKGMCTPLDYLVLRQMEAHPDMILRNRIAWTFGHGLHASNRFSGRHETILWFTKGKDYEFDLDAVRIVQKYPGKLSSRGDRKGQPSGNPSGKNPSDVWDMPNVNANHVEKTEHPCQFPIGLAQRLIRALTKDGDVVLDPFCGVGSAGAAALFEGRRFIGAELDSNYIQVAAERLRLASRGELRYRPADRAIHVPTPGQKVVARPEGFAVSIDAEVSAS